MRVWQFRSDLKTMGCAADVCGPAWSSPPGLAAQQAWAGTALSPLEAVVPGDVKSSKTMTKLLLNLR